MCMCSFVLDDFLCICLLLPGSIINQVFHEVLLDTCSNLTSLCWPQDSGKKRKKDGLKSSQAEGKRSKPQRKDASEEVPGLKVTQTHRTSYIDVNDCYDVRVINVRARTHF